MNGDLDISAKIEALLFFKGDPVSIGFLAKMLNVSDDDTRSGLDLLEKTLSGRGIMLMRNGDEYMLGTAPQMGQIIETILKEELSKDLGKAGLETLAIVLYRGPVLRSEINYIRGVNSNYILRALLVRGLIEKVDQSGRSTAYRPTFELLSYMGVKKVEDLPEYENTIKAVEEFHEANDKYEHEEGKGMDIGGEKA